MVDEEYLENLKAELKAIDEIADMLGKAHTEHDLRVVEITTQILALKHQIAADIYNLSENIKKSHIGVCYNDSREFEERRGYSQSFC